MVAPCCSRAVKADGLGRQKRILTGLVDPSSLKKNYEASM